MSQYITTTGLKNTMQSFLNKLKEWLPIKKEDSKVKIQGPSFKDAMEIDIDGEIKIIGTNTNPVSLRSWIDSKGTIIVDTYEDALQYQLDQYLGSFIYIKNSSGENYEGLYLVCLKPYGGSVILSRIGTTTSSEDINIRIDKLEGWIENPLTNNEIDILTDEDPENDKTIINNLN